MPGFGDNPDDDDDPNDDEPGDGMFTHEMICSVAKYEASLGEDPESQTAPITQRCESIIEDMTEPTTTTTVGGGAGSADEEPEE